MPKLNKETIVRGSFFHRSWIGFIDLIYAMAGRAEIRDTDLFELHIEKRKAYIDILVQYQIEAGIPNADKELIKQGVSLDQFKAFCSESWKKSLDLVDRAHQRQAARNERPRLK